MNWYKRHIKMAMPKKREWADEELEIIKELIEEGNSFREIAKLFNTSHHYISSLDAKYQWSKVAKKRIADEKAAKIKELTDKGYSIQQISDESGINLYNVRKIIKDYNIPTNFIQPPKIPEGKAEEIRKLYVEDELGLTEISKITGIHITTVLDNLKRMGVYNKIRDLSPYFNPSQEEIKKIDYWYTLPPKGEGRSINWISKKLSIGDGVLNRWFRQTGRQNRTREEQVRTQTTRDDMALAHLLLWEQRGGLEGYLKTFENKDKAIIFLNNFVHKVMFKEQNVGMGMAIKTKYMQIINEHTYPDEVQQPQPV